MFVGGAAGRGEAGRGPDSGAALLAEGGSAVGRRSFPGRVIGQRREERGEELLVTPPGRLPVEGAVGTHAQTHTQMYTLKDVCWPFCPNGGDILTFDPLQYHKKHCSETC